MIENNRRDVSVPVSIYILMIHKQLKENVDELTETSSILSEEKINIIDSEIERDTC